MRTKILVAALLVGTLSWTYETVLAATWAITAPTAGQHYKKTSDISCGGTVDYNGKLAYIVEAIQGTTIYQSSAGQSSVGVWGTVLGVPDPNWPTGTLTLKLTSFEGATNTPLTRDVEIDN